MIAYEDYRDILSDAGMRDALVLYCEVAEEEKAIEIAKFCWKTIQSNIEFADNIHTKEAQELVCVLYFMKEAFRNRKQVLSDFNNDFYQLVKEIFDQNNPDEKYLHIDYVVRLAFVNAMVLFSKAQLQNLVLMVFRMNNRWLNDVIVQNCRILDTLGYHIENEFVRYFNRMDIRIFMRRFWDMQFSLSVSEKFRYVRKMHIMTMILNILCILGTIPLTALLVVDLFENFIYKDKGIFFQNIMQELTTFDGLNAMIDAENTSLLSIVSTYILCIIMMICFEVCVEKFFFLQSRVIISELGLIISLAKLPSLQSIRWIGSVICVAAVITAVILMCIHDFKFYISNRDYVENALKFTAGKYKKVITHTVLFVNVVFIIIGFFQKIFIIASIVLMILFFGILFCILVFFGLSFLKDCIWLRKHSVENKYMPRAQLEENLESLYFDGTKHKYLELLLLQNTELTGKWTNDSRPQYEDDRVNHALVKLDCMKLDSCDYLF